MELLKQRIAQEGEVKGDSVLRVDRFLNHQIDVKLLKEIALEFYRRFGQKEITKVLPSNLQALPLAPLSPTRSASPWFLRKNIKVPIWATMSIRSP